MSLDLERREESPLVSSVDDLVDYFRKAETPRGEFKVGLEHEKFVYLKNGTTGVPYEGEQGIGQLLQALTTRGYHAFRETDGAPIIALTKDALTVSLEPGGQLELSGTPLRTAREAHQENLSHLEHVKLVASELGLRLVGLGYRPFGTPADMPWMPKSRYRAMRASLPERGSLALDMMLMTATAQVSFDWMNEEDCARKVTLISQLTPLMVALYANSPIVNGKPSGWMSFRSQVWTDVDPTRCGYFPAMLDGTFSYLKYIDWALDAPLLFLRRGGRYLRPPLNFRQFMRDGFEEHRATMEDWADHLSTMFPEVRIKRVIEVRGADAASLPMTGGLAALWRGILYDDTALSEAEALFPRLSYQAHHALQEVARRQGLAGRLGRRNLAEWATDVIDIAKRGLSRLDSQDMFLLEPLSATAASGRSPGQEVLDVWSRHADGDKLLEHFCL